MDLGVLFPKCAPRMESAFSVSVDQVPVRNPFQEQTMEIVSFDPNSESKLGGINRQSCKRKISGRLEEENSLSSRSSMIQEFIIPKSRFSKMKFPSERKTP